MRRLAGSLVAGLALTGLVLSYGVSPASALSFAGTYFEITAPVGNGVGNLGGGGNGNTSSLVNPVCALFTCFGGVGGSVAGSLSGGQPVAAGGHFAEGNGNQVLLWTIGNHVGTSGNVALDTVHAADTFFDGAGGSTNFLNSAGSSFFADAQANNNTLYRAVHWSGLFSAPGGANFSINSDDHAFLFVDGALEVDAGGIKSLGAGTFTGFLPASPGNHQFDLFFADVFSKDSGILVSCTGCEDPISAVPEPTSLLLFGTTLAGLGTVVRRKFRRQDPV